MIDSNRRISGIRRSLRRGDGGGQWTVWLMWLAAFVALTSEWVLAIGALGGVGNGWTGATARAVGEVALILLPYWFLSGRWRLTILLPVWIASLWWVANLWYYRFWGELLSPMSFMMTGNVDGTLLDSVRGVWRPADFWFLILPAGVTAVTLRLARRLRSGARLRGRQMALASAGSIALFIFSQAIYTRGMMRDSAESYDRHAGVWATTRDRIAMPMFSKVSVLKLNGVLIYTVRSIGMMHDVLHTHRDLSPQERREVESFLSLTDSLNTKALQSIPDSVARANAGKNVVMIIVESLNSDVLGLKIGGRSVTPTLDSLIDARGTLSALRMVSQVKDGCSGDGQMLYNAGLLPLSAGSAAIAVGADHPFRSLAGSFGGDVAAVMADDAGMWNERATFGNYGYRHILTTLDRPGEAEARGADAVMFDQAEGLLRSLRRPFMICMVTLSMHVPFTDPGVPEAGWIDSAEGYGRHFRNYLRMTNYFDAALGLFIATLRRDGLADDTILIVAADHSQSMETHDGAGETYSYIPVIIANCGLTRRIAHPVGQVDVYPTLLRLTGRWHDDGYNGLGRLLTDPALRGATDPELRPHGDVGDAAERKRQAEAYRVADMILRSGYYGGK